MQRRSTTWSGARRAGLVVAIALSLTAGNVSSQVLYEKRGPDGPVFSDAPLPGGRPAAVPADNTMAAPVKSRSPAPPPSLDAIPDAAREQARPFRYSSFAIVYPENAGSASANTAAFMVRVRIEPPLRLDLGHAMAIRLNGQPLPGRYTQEDFVLPPEAFGDTVSLNQRYRLEASIVDAQGVALISAAPVDFYLRLAPRLPRPSR